MSREYPATSAARTAAKRRTGDISGAAPIALLEPVLKNVCDDLSVAPAARLVCVMQRRIFMVEDGSE
jgi:hypothetical protein